MPLKISYNINEIFSNSSIIRGLVFIFRKNHLTNAFYRHIPSAMFINKLSHIIKIKNIFLIIHNDKKIPIFAFFYTCLNRVIYRKFFVNHNCILNK